MNDLKKKKLKKKKDIYCGNCGKFGHTYKKCEEPITSLGIILYKTYQKKNFSNEKSPEKKDCNIYNNLKQINSNEDLFKFLLIQRKDSIGYVEFIRGRYKLDNIIYLRNIFGEMTKDETKRLLNIEFDKLWEDLWMTKNNKQYRNEFETSKIKFYTLKNGTIIDGENINLETIIKSIKDYWDETEWGFPKGRRNLKESDINCADREFQEETGFNEGEYVILKNIDPVEETFIGTNNITYKHIYYVGKCITDKDVFIQKDNKTQIAEVKNIGWFDLNTSLNKLRPYNIEKKNVLKKVYDIINKNNLDKENYILYKSPKLREIIGNEEIEEDIVVI